jgi:hypothetical protein
MGFKERRKEAREGKLKLCTTCVKRPPLANHKHCETCLESMRVSAQKRRKKLKFANDIRWCDECQAFGFHRRRINGESDCPILDMLEAAESLGLDI